MNNKDLLTMQCITDMAIILIDAWRTSKCPDSATCIKCKYNDICAKIEDLSKVVSK